MIELLYFHLVLTPYNIKLDSIKTQTDKHIARIAKNLYSRHNKTTKLVGVHQLDLGGLLKIHVSSSGTRERGKKTKTTISSFLCDARQG